MYWEMMRENLTGKRRGMLTGRWMVMLMEKWKES
jgi:hypothetical protein